MKVNKVTLAVVLGVAALVMYASVFIKMGG
jgi:hypothetical protein